MDDLALRLEALGFSSSDFELEDNGTGPQISIWRSNQPIPSPAALQAVSAQRIQNARKDRIAGRAFSDGVIDALITVLAGHLNVTADSLRNEIRNEL